jgi:hypothetical protein
MTTSHSMVSSAQPDTPHVIIGALMFQALMALLLLAGGCTPPSHFIVGLTPDYPGLPSCDRGLCPPFSIREPRIDTLRPTLRWERFPREWDLWEIGHHADKRIADVSYELRLWKVGKDFSGEIERPGSSSGWIGSADDYKYSWGHACRDTDPGELVYAKSGLPHPEHILETPLQPATRYFWSVRGHFTLDGKRRATEWSEQLHRERLSTEFSVRPCSIPATFHLFRTP